jgi:hypothetical protein
MSTPNLLLSFETSQTTTNRTELKQTNSMYDSNFGGGSEEDLSPSWQEAAKANVNDYLTLRAGCIARFKKLLDDKGIDLRPGDDRQLLGFLRAAMCDEEKAVNVVQDFVELHTFFKDSMIIGRAGSKLRGDVNKSCSDTAMTTL